ncbi:PucR family transcriptional regulator [Brevibacterium sp. UCMA 11754]|uniref:PucR family transcriptional regulator n=1 Tax=Brevibacterium sp. UCMA 11754 TaxID=2749198 RepID=UPI001F4723D1|nr:helix-turn-helix domain-containing protein [Brevibacterium sp. UCMA 11754]MCF2571780.1 helix-turn-helix domain-containing protein [Brevibacterium sp. UCMA 11754]
MSETNALRVSRLLRETAGFLLPLTQTEIDVEVTRIEFDLDLRSSAAALRSPTGLAGAVVLVTEAVDGVAGLNAIRSRFAGAAALIVPPGTHTHLGEGTSASALPILLERSTGVTWSEVLVHLRQLNEGASSALAWPDVDDLSALAAVIAEMTGASITIEDPASRVLAHSNLGDEIDDIRRETILSGAIPQWRIAELEESGFLDVVRHSTDVVERQAAGASPARSVIALRSEGELLGTIWAAYPDSVDPASLRDVLRDAARAALPVMLRTLRRSPFEKRIRREALGSILGGSPDLGPAATLLALPFSGHYATLAFAEVAPDREPVLRFHLRAAFADAVLAHVGSDGHLAVLVHMSEGMEAADIRSHVASALQRSLSPSEPLHFGVGVAVERLDLVHRSWTEAVYVIDALLTRSKSGASTPAGSTTAGNHSAGVTCADDQSMVRGATAEDVAAELVGLEAADALRPVGPRITEPARLLAEHDAKHQGQLLETLRVYFATVGNSAEASRRLHVHTNSLRHRLSRIEEITGLSTAERSGRLWLELAVLVFDRERA